MVLDLLHPRLRNPEEPPPAAAGADPEFPADRRGTGDGPEPEDMLVTVGLQVRHGPVQAPGPPDPDEDDLTAVHDLEIARTLPVLPEKIHGSPLVCEGQGPLDRLLRYRPPGHDPRPDLRASTFARLLWNSRLTGRVRILTL